MGPTICAGKIFSLLFDGIRERVLRVLRQRLESVVAALLVHLQLILPLDGKIDELPREGDVPRLESESAVGRHRRLIRQHAVVVGEHLHRAGLLHAGWRFCRHVASRRENRHAIERIDEDLMRVNATVDNARLRHFRAERSVGVDRPHRQPGRRVVVCRQQIASRIVGRDVHRPLQQRRRSAEFRERAGFLVDAERADALFAERHDRLLPALHATYSTRWSGDGHAY